MSREDNQITKKDKRRLIVNVFNNIRAPDKIKEFYELQKNLSSLKQDVNILQAYTSSKITTKKVLKKIFHKKCYSNSPYKRKENNLYSIVSPKKNINSKVTKTISQHKNSLNKNTEKTYNKNTYDNLFITNLSSDENNNPNLTINTNVNSNLKNKKRFIKDNIYNLRSNMLPALQSYNYYFTSIQSKKNNNGRYNNNIHKSFDNYSKNNKKIDKLKKLFMNNNFNSSITSNSNKSSLKNLKPCEISRNCKTIDNNLPKISNNLAKKTQKNCCDISNKIKSRLFDYNFVKWDINSRIKYLEWKYGILEIDKYFMDIDGFNKPLELELDKNKNIFDKAADVIFDIQKTQSQKSINITDKKYGIRNKLFKKNKNLDEKKDIDIFLEKRMDIYRNLQLINLRKKLEKRSRKKINDLLFKCKRGVNLINKSTFERKKEDGYDN